ncbi:MAG: RluA family pseudouridine synthase [Candidatus Rokuibacteriota bacterium]
MQPVTTVSAGLAPRRLDIFVATQTAHLSRAAAQRWIDGGLITVNGRQTKPARLIRPGDVITCHVPVREPPPVDPEPLALHVLHEDAEILVIDKPPGLVMHPGPGHWTGTLLNALVHHVGHEPGDGRRARPGLVHRLDKGTSGVLVIAKTDAAHRDLSRQFRAHSVHRVYLALVAGAVRRGGLIERALGRDTRDRRRVSTRSPATRRAVTEYRVAERLGPDATLVEARPRTGRTHQIRVHLASIGHPVLGDASYGMAPADPALPRAMLHAAVLGFAHPASGEYVEFRAPLPADMEHAVARCRAESGRSD